MIGSPAHLRPRSRQRGDDGRARLPAAAALVALAAATAGGGAAARGAVPARVTVTASDGQVAVVELSLGTYRLSPGPTDCATSGRPSFHVLADGLSPLESLPVTGVLLGIPASGTPVLTVESVDEEPLSPGPRGAVLEGAHERCANSRRQPSEVLGGGRDAAARGGSGDASPDVDWTVGGSSVPAGAAAVLDAPGWIRGQRVVRLELRPFAYDAATNVLRVRRSMRVAVRMAGARAGDGVGRTGSAPAPAAGTVQGATRAEPDGFEAVYAAALGNYEASRPWRVDRGPVAGRAGAARGEPGSRGPTATGPDEPRWNIQVDADGMYRVTGAALAAAGRDPSTIDPSRLRLLHGDGEVAIEVDGGDDGRLDAGDAVVFFGRATRSKYDPLSTYQLLESANPGRRFAVRDGAPGAEPPTTAFSETLRLEPNLVHVPDRPLQPPSAIDDRGTDRWYWARLAAPGTVTWTVALPGAVPTGRAAIRVAVVGGSDLPDVANDHGLRLWIGDTAVGDVGWDGVGHAEVFTFPVDPTMLAGGSVELRLEAAERPGVPYDQYYVDWIEISYSRRLAAEGSQLLFGSFAPDTTMAISGFDSASLRAYDIHDPDLPVRVTGVVVEPDGGTHLATMRSGALWSGRHAIVGEDGFRAPVRVVARPAPELWRGPGADILVIAHASLLDAIRPLADRRAAAGRRVAVIDVQRVYDLFGDGSTDPEAIRRFVSHTYESWPVPPPSALLLVGDATFDPRLYLPDSRATLLPTPLLAVDPVLGEVATDNHLVAVVGSDRMPDLYVGRLAVDTAAEATDLIGKILRYETSRPGGDWLRRLLFVADDPDAGGDFPGLTEDVVRGHVPAAYQVGRVYHAASTPPETTRQRIVDGWNEGALIVHYVGHGRTQSWGAEGLLRTGDLTTLANGGRLPLLLDVTSLTGAFADPRVDSMAETAVELAEDGAIAAFAATGGAVAVGHDILDRAFTGALLGRGVTPVGAVALAAKLELYRSTSIGRDLLDTYVLLGDPSLSVAVPVLPTATWTATATSATATAATPVPSDVPTSEPTHTPDVSGTPPATASSSATATPEPATETVTPDTGTPDTGTPTGPTPGAGTTESPGPSATPTASGTHEPAPPGRAYLPSLRRRR